MDYWYTQQLGWIFTGLCQVGKPISKGYKLYDSIYIALLGWQNYRSGEHIS